MARLLSYIHHTSDLSNIVMWEIPHNNADWNCFRILILREILRIQNPLLEGILCTFGSHTFVPTSWVCKKQTRVSHTSTDSEIISPDAGLRMDGISPLDLWDLVIEVLYSSFNQTRKSKETVQGDLLRNKPLRKHTDSQTKTQIQYNDHELSNVDYVSSNVKSSESGANCVHF